MKPIKLRLKLQSGKGYGYFLIPPGQLPKGDDMSVLVTVDDRQTATKVLALHSGEHIIQLSQETLGVLFLKPGQTYTVYVERTDAPPQLNDMATDFLTALQSARIEEDFKRLPQTEQIDLFYQVKEAASAEGRESAIQKVVQIIQVRHDELPRGDSL